MNYIELRTKAATSDLRLARKEGVITVCQTVIGNIQIAYSSGIYTLTNFNMGTFLMAGKAKDAVAFLAAQYAIEEC